MARKALTLALLALMAVTAHAQHFDWVKSYTGTDRQNKIDNYIVGSVTDSDGSSRRTSPLPSTMPPRITCPS